MRLSGQHLAEELDEINLLSTSFQDFELIFIPRTFNFRADSLAKGSRSRAELFSVVDALAPTRHVQVAFLNGPE